MKTQFITDDHGKKLAVVLPIDKYQELMEEMEDLEDIKLYDEAIKNDDGKRISFDEYLKKRKAKRKND